MQLSEDGNYMWNGTEWLPVEAQEEQQQPVQETSVQPPIQSNDPAGEVQQVAPQTAMQTLVVMPQGNDTKSIINLASALSVFKYGIIALGGWIVSMIVLTILWGAAFYLAFDSGDAVVGLIIITGALILTIIAYGQMIIYPVGKALKDGRYDASKFSYVDSWKTSIAGFVESSIVIVLMAVVTGVGYKYDVDGLMYLGAFAYLFFLLGYIPYMVRKAAEIIK
tara:strand:+ start:1009 stop:1674 length:666 start_codon:yes stop_codon:yes gene_type:complete